MRNCKKNQRTLYYALFTGTQKLKDEYGNDTLEVEKIYSDPIKMELNISASVGGEAVQVFGSLSNYSRVILTTDINCPINEGSHIWFGVSTDKPHNYEVVKVADSKNSLLIAISEVSVSI